MSPNLRCTFNPPSLPSTQNSPLLILRRSCCCSLLREIVTWSGCGRRDHEGAGSVLRGAPTSVTSFCCGSVFYVFQLTCQVKEERQRRNTLGLLKFNGWEEKIMKSFPVRVERRVWSYDWFRVVDILKKWVKEIPWNTLSFRPTLPQGSEDHHWPKQLCGGKGQDHLSSSPAFPPCFQSGSKWSTSWVVGFSRRQGHHTPTASLSKPLQCGDFSLTKGQTPSLSTTLSCWGI